MGRRAILTDRRQRGHQKFNYATLAEFDPFEPSRRHQSGETAAKAPNWTVSAVQFDLLRRLFIGIVSTLWGFARFDPEASHSKYHGCCRQAEAFGFLGGGIYFWPTPRDCLDMPFLLLT